VPFVTQELEAAERKRWAQEKKKKVKTANPTLIVRAFVALWNADDEQLVVFAIMSSILFFFSFFFPLLSPSFRWNSNGLNNG